MKLEELLEIIKGGENERVEFKKSFTKNIGEEIVALANAEGGYILIGVDDNGKIVGVDSKNVIERITNILMSISPKLNVKIDKISIDGKEIVVIHVPKSKEIVTIGDIAYIRIGTGKRALSIQEIVIRGVENVLIYWDTLPSNVPVSEISKERFMKYLEERKRIRKKIYFGNLMEDLKNSKAIVKKNGKYYLTNAAVLFFTENPQVYLPNSTIRFMELDKEGEIINQKTFEGPLPEIIDNVMDFLFTKIGKVSIRVGAKRETFWEYPERAVREAVTNAVAHRNYLLQADIRISLHPDKLVIRSPGGLPPGVDLKHPEHVPRNPLICQYLFDFGYIEKYGTGIRMIRKEVKRHPFVEVEFISRPLYFEIIFKKEYKSLDPIDRDIIRLRKAGMSLGEIAKKLGKSKSTIHRRLEKLREMGLVDF